MAKLLTVMAVGDTAAGGEQAEIGRRVPLHTPLSKAGECMGSTEVGQFSLKEYLHFKAV